MDHPATVNAGNRGTEESECSEPNEVDEELDGIILMADVGVNVLEESPAHDAAPTDINDATLCLAIGGAKLNHVLCNHWGPTALYKAALAGNIGLVQHMLRAGVERNFIDTKNGVSVLLAAAYKGGSEMVELLLASGVDDVNLGRTSNGRNPLHVAAKKKDAKMLQMLIKANADVNRPMNDGVSALMLATSGLAAVELLLRCGAKVNQAEREYGHTPLLYAVSEGQDDVVMALLEHHADVDQATTDDGTFPLFVAAENGFTSCVTLLYRHGALLNQRKTSCAIFSPASPHNGHGYSALYAAAKNGFDEIVRFLIEEGASAVSTDDEWEVTPLMIAARNKHLKVVNILLSVQPTDINRSEKGHGTTALSLAARYGTPDMVSLLLSNKADVDETKKGSGSTAITWACMNKGSPHMHEIVQVLLNSSADVEKSPQDGFRPLHHAVQNGDGKLASMLLKHGADVNSQAGFSRNTPLQLALINGNISNVKLLLENKANVGQTNADGKAPLAVAVLRNQCAIARELLWYEAEVNQVVASSGFTPLHYAVLHGRFEMVNVLLEGRAEVNVLSQSDGTPLHIAARTDNVELVQHLLEFGASIDSPGESDNTPLMEAVLAGQVAAMDTLLQHGADANRVNGYSYSALHLAAAHGMHSAQMAKLLIDYSANVELCTGDGEHALQLIPVHYEETASFIRFLTSVQEVREFAKTQTASQMSVQLSQGNMYPEPAAGAWLTAMTHDESMRLVSWAKEQVYVRKAVIAGCGKFVNSTFSIRFFDIGTIDSLICAFTFACISKPQILYEITKFENLARPGTFEYQKSFVAASARAASVRRSFRCQLEGSILVFDQDASGTEAAISDHPKKVARNT